MFIKHGWKLVPLSLGSLLLIGCNGNDAVSPADSTDAAHVVSQPSDLNCVDQQSSNDTWDDNCVLKQGGLYARSNYTLGIQFILWCAGFATDSQGGTVLQDEFVNGSFEATTDSAVVRFQVSQQLPTHGAVGALTWIALREQLQLVGASAAEYSTYTVQDSVACKEQVYFYQRNTSPHDWKLAASPDDTALVDFSIAAPVVSNR